MTANHQLNIDAERIKSSHSQELHKAVLILDETVFNLEGAITKKTKKI